RGATNMVGNAIRFARGGGRVAVPRAQAPEAVFTTGRNTGRGSRAGPLPHIFEPFRQTGPQMAGTDGGLGLGLSIAKQIVELHGGTIAATSDGAGRGASFIVRLPPARLGAGSEADVLAHDARS